MATHTHAGAELSRSQRVWHAALRTIAGQIMGAGLRRPAPKNKVVMRLIPNVNGETKMSRSRRGLLIVSFALLAAAFASAQESAGTLSAEALKKVVPSTYFFRGQSAPVQLRNSAGFTTANGMFALAGLVDTSGYASDIQQKYQGFLITEVKLSIEGSDLPAGAYGFGFEKDGNFAVMDVGAHDLF